MYIINSTRDMICIPAFVCMFASRKYMYLSVKVFSSNTEHLYSDLVDMYACMHRGEISENHKEEIST